MGSDGGGCEFWKSGKIILHVQRKISKYVRMRMHGHRMLREATCVHCNPCAAYFCDSRTVKQDIYTCSEWAGTYVGMQLERDAGYMIIIYYLCYLRDAERQVRTGGG